MSQSLPAAVIRNTFSLAELYLRADLLQRFLEHLFFGSGQKDGDRAQRLRAYYSEEDAETKRHVEAVAAWGAEVLDTFGARTLYEDITAFKKSAKDCPVLTLYVPVRFSSIQAERVGVWCRAHLQSGVMLDLKVDASTVGGCALAYQNAFHNVSFSYFEAKEHPALVKLVREYDA